MMHVYFVNQPLKMHFTPDIRKGNMRGEISLSPTLYILAVLTEQELVYLPVVNQGLRPDSTQPPAIQVQAPQSVHV